MHGHSLKGPVSILRTRPTLTHCGLSSRPALGVGHSHRPQPAPFFHATPPPTLLATMSEPKAYPKHARSTVHRYRTRADYDFSTIHSIVDSSPILHVSFLPSDPADDPFPTILPMIGQMGSFSNPSADPAVEPLDLYIHGHVASRLMRLPSSPSTPPEGLPVCIAATILDGIVLALTPFNHSCNYRSAVIHGYATPVTDEEERLFGMRLITNGLVPARWENSRVPPTKGEAQSTQILKITVESASAKWRVGGPGNIRKDVMDEGVIGRVWTGVVPVWQTLGELQEGEDNKVEKVPEYLEQWREDKNRMGEQHAYEVARNEKE